MSLDDFRRGGLLIAAWVAVGCSQHTAQVPAVARVAEPVIYGDDDRVEPQALSHLAWVAGVSSRAIALVPAIPASSSGEEEDAGALGAQTAGERLQLCPEERFADQPGIADCSGVLVASDVVLTAGHCFTEEDECDRYLYAADYVHDVDDAGADEITLLRCEQLILREVGQLADGSPIDYALIRLESVVESSAWHPGSRDTPSRDEAVEPEDEVTSAGFPAGLPLKIDPNGKVLDVDRTGFTLIADAYHGSSGSGVYDVAGRLVGMLTGGQADFEWDVRRGCRLSRVIATADAGAADAGAAERAMHAWVALSRACLRAPDLELCREAADGGVEDAAIDDATLVTEPMQPPDDAGDKLVEDNPTHAAPDATSQDPRRVALSEGADASLAEGRAQRSAGCSTTRGSPLPSTPILVLFSCLLVRHLRRGCHDEPAAVSIFLQRADYYLIAQAQAGKHIVVSHEVTSPSTRKIKIPDACLALGIKRVSPYEMLRQEQARFVLGRSA